MAKETIDLTFPIMRYDITMPLLEGRVEIEGVQLRPAHVPVMIFNEQSELKDGNFGLCDLNLGYLLPAIEAGWEIIGLPIFSKRKPAYPFIFCRTDAGIHSPQDLEGKRVGSARYRTAITTWARGLLQDYHGVDIQKLKWVALERDMFPLHSDHLQIEYATHLKQTNVVDMLINGDLDAIITDISDPKLFHALESSPKVKRLFPNYMDEDLRLYQETGIYTPVHIMVMSRKLDRHYPELAARLFQAFEQAKSIAYNDILSERGGFSTVYLRESLEKQMEIWGDPWKYGFKANKTTIDHFIRYNYEQGATKSILSYNDIFAGSTLET